MLFGLPFVRFVPGYAFIAVLFPEAGSGPVDDDRERLRLAFLLYQGEAPREPTVENAYRERHLWVNVSAST